MIYNLYNEKTIRTISKFNYMKIGKREWEVAPEIFNYNLKVLVL